VKGRLIASMLVLGHNWPLAEALDNHRLVAFITDQHRIHHELLKQWKQMKQQATVQPEASQAIVTRASDSDTASPLKGSPREEDEERPLDLRCTRCEKHIGRVSSPVVWLMYSKDAGYAFHDHHSFIHSFTIHSFMKHIFYP